jgi:hypothetical protein
MNKRNKKILEKTAFIIGIIAIIITVIAMVAMTLKG